MKASNAIVKLEKRMRKIEANQLLIIEMLQAQNESKPIVIEPPTIEIKPEEPPKPKRGRKPKADKAVQNA
jgi:hypothetical protein